MNFDPRSVSLNTEMSIIFGHCDPVGQSREVSADETSPQKSYRIRLDVGEIIWQDNFNGAVRILRNEPGASVWRRLAATIIGHLPIDSQL